MVYGDFGEKIGGARKDEWSLRGLLAEDLDSMTSREADEYVKKANVWKKPDYQSLIDEGRPADVVYFIKKVRDCLHAAPRYYRSDDTPEKKMARRKEYVATVRMVQAAVEKVRTRQEAMNVFQDILVNGGYIEKIVPGISGNTIYASQKGRDNDVITSKLILTLYFRSEQDFERKITREAGQKQFGLPKEAVRGKRQQCTGKTKKTRFVPVQLQHIRRTGPDFRCGYDATGRDYLETFGFRGGEFGNWMNQNDRRESMNMGYEALKDLASALQVSDRDISYQGSLAIAFGSRGRGNASAHYEPLRKVINLTKMHGAGSLAHEWWHGLDDYLGGLMGSDGMLSENPRLDRLFLRLVDTMKWKTVYRDRSDVREKNERRLADLRGRAGNLMDAVMLYPLARLADEGIMQSYSGIKEDFISGSAGTVERANSFMKEITGRMIPKKERERLMVFERILISGPDMQDEGDTPVKVKTDFYKNSIRMGKNHQKDGGYWDSNCEMSARAFACYIKDRLPYRSDYLTGHAESAVDIIPTGEGSLEVIKAYPEGEEREAINKVFDEIFRDLKERGVLTHCGQTPSLERVRRGNTLQTKTVDFPEITHARQLTLFDVGY